MLLISGQALYLVRVLPFSRLRSLVFRKYTPLRRESSVVDLRLG